MTSDLDLPLGHDLHCEVHDGAGPPMLLVHGLLSSRAQWRPNLAALQEISRPVVVELLGNGRSPAPSGASPYRPDAYVKAFERVLAHIFTNSNSALASDEWTRAARPGMQALSEELSRNGLSAIERMPIHPKRARQLPADVKAELVADCEIHSAIGIANSCRYTVIGSSVRERARKNRVPTLLVQGIRERRFREHAIFATEQIPNLEHVALEAGHALNLEQPQAFNEAVVEFTTRRASRA